MPRAKGEVSAFCAVSPLSRGRATRSIPAAALILVPDRRAAEFVVVLDEAQKQLHKGLTFLDAENIQQPALRALGFGLERCRHLPPLRRDRDRPLAPIDLADGLLQETAAREPVDHIG